MYNIQEETNVKALSECLRLGRMHYSEVYADKEDKVPMNYNWQFLDLCLKNNLMHIITARDENGTLIGYFADLVSPDMLSSVFVAKDIAIFIHPDHRGRLLFKKMLKAMEELLIKNGVTTHYMAFQKGHSERLPLAYGYKPREIVYEKFLEEN